MAEIDKKLEIILEKCFTENDQLRARLTELECLYSSSLDLLEEKEKIIEDLNATIKELKKPLKKRRS